jgi:hypothetical protein
MTKCNVNGINEIDFTFPGASAVTVNAGVASLTVSEPSGTANEVMATPNGSSGVASLRAIAPTDLPIATTLALGVVEPDGTTITITGAGVISSVGGGGSSVSVVTKTANYTAVNGNLVLCNTTSASFTVTLPAPTLDSTVSVKKISSDVNTVTISPSSGLIEGVATMTITTLGDCMDLAADGTNFWII